MGLGPSFCKHCLVDMEFVDDLNSKKNRFGDHLSGVWLCPKCGSVDDICLLRMPEEMIKKMDEQNNSSWLKSVLSAKEVINRQYPIPPIPDNTSLQE